jgi:hypothetical protein
LVVLVQAFKTAHDEEELLITGRDRDLDLGLVAVEQDDGGPRPGRWLVALPLPAEGTLGRTAPDRLLFEDDLVRSPGDGGIVPGERKAALLLFRGREDKVELLAGAAIVGVTKRLVLRAASSVPVRFPSPPTSVNSRGYRPPAPETRVLENLTSGVVH